MGLREFQNYLKQQDIDLVFLVHPDSNITYFTGIKLSQAQLFISPRTARLYLTQLDKRPLLKKISLSLLTGKWEKELAKCKVKTMGLNERNIPFYYFKKLKQIFPRTQFVDVSAQLRTLRSQKSPEELDKIAKASIITTNSFHSLLSHFSPGKFKTELDIALYLEKSIREQGAEPAFPTIVATGKNAAIPHYLTSRTKLKQGFLLLDFGASYNHYCADMSRVLYLGSSVKYQEKEKYNILLAAQEGVIKKVAPRVLFSLLEAEAKKLLGKYSPQFIHSVGHGIGIDIHEFPSFAVEAKQTVSAGNVFTIEPGIYFPGKYGLRIEDTIAFDGRTWVMTSAAKELVRLK